LFLWFGFVLVVLLGLFLLIFRDLCFLFVVMAISFLVSSLFGGLSGR